MQKAKHKTRNIGDKFADDRLIESAIKSGIQDAALRYKRAGMKMAAWRDGKVVEVDPDEILTPVKPRTKKKTAVKKKAAKVGRGG